MLCNEGRVSLQNYLGSIIIFSLICFVNYYSGLCDIYTILVLTLLYSITGYLMLRCYYNQYMFGIAIRAAGLGLVFALGNYVYLIGADNIRIFGIYMTVMSVFHYAEFLAISVVQPKLVSTDSYVINHSPQYTIAAVASWLEFALESYFFPGAKQFPWTSFVGLIICVLGETLRLEAIFTAGSNFNHLVQCEKSNDHVLVTHGVYGWLRHPSYVGWFYWAIGTQIILLNPICIPLYALASWHFFKSRIYIEEIMLLNFFGQQYCDYQQKVGTGMPFIEGYKM